MAREATVTRSIETPDGLRCVDLLGCADGTYRFAEFRRDPEDPRGWAPTGCAEAGFPSEAAALAAARARVPWLGAVLG